MVKDVTSEQNDCYERQGFRTKEEKKERRGKREREKQRLGSNGGTGQENIGINNKILTIEG